MKHADVTSALAALRKAAETFCRGCALTFHDANGDLTATVGCVATGYRGRLEQRVVVTFYGVEFTCEVRAVPFLPEVGGTEGYVSRDQVWVPVTLRDGRMQMRPYRVFSHAIAALRDEAWRARNRERRGSAYANRGA